MAKYVVLISKINLNSFLIFKQGQDKQKKIFITFLEQIDLNKQKKIFIKFLNKVRFKTLTIRKWDYKNKMFLDNRVEGLHSNQNLKNEA
jgi:hypothetical protein